MRWHNLFDDLEAQLAHQDVQVLLAEVDERARAERAKVDLAQRLLAHSGRIRLTVAGTEVAGQVADAAPQWLLLTDGVRETLVPVAAIDCVEGLTRQVAAPAGQVLRRLGLGHVLRAVARDRSAVQIGLLSGVQLSGTLDRIGADHCDLACHEAGEWRRAAAVNSVVTVPFSRLAVVRRVNPGGA